MRNNLTAIALRFALFLMLASLFMLLFVPFGTAEWYVSLFSAILMLLFIVIVKIVIVIKDRRDKR